MNISHVWLENAYSRPRNYGLWGIDPLNGEIYQQNPQRHILPWKGVTGRTDRQNRSTGATCVLHESNTFLLKIRHWKTMAMKNPRNSPLPLGHVDPPLIHLCRDQPHALTTPNGIRIHSAVLPQYTSRTNRQTDGLGDKPVLRVSAYAVSI